MSIDWTPSLHELVTAQSWSAEDCLPCSMCGRGFTSRQKNWDWQRVGGKERTWQRLIPRYVGDESSEGVRNWALTAVEALKEQVQAERPCVSSWSWLVEFLQMSILRSWDFLEDIHGIAIVHASGRPRRGRKVKVWFVVALVNPSLMFLRSC